MEKRRYGKTTGEILIALGKAISDPGKEISYEDHAVRGYQNSKIFKPMVEDIIKKLGLKEISVKHIAGSTQIKSNYHPVYVGSDGSVYRKVS